ncbi:MAG: VOC family protein [Bacillota bacterium]
MQNQQVTQTIVPYFMVLSASQFIEFTEKVFRSEVVNVNKLEDTEGVIHAEMKIGESTIYFADTSHDGSCGPGICGDLMNDGLVPIQMYIYVENVEDTYVKAIKAGATSIMEVMKDEDGGYMAGFVDPFSHLWWVHSKK